MSGHRCEPPMKNDQMKMTKAPLASCLFMAAPLMAADYDVDAAHTTVQFKVGHLGFSELVGRFNTFGGTFQHGRRQPGGGQGELRNRCRQRGLNHEARDGTCSPGISWT